MPACREQHPCKYHWCPTPVCADVNECAGVVCGGSGSESTCVDGINLYECFCSEGYSGGGINAVCTGRCGDTSALVHPSVVLCSDLRSLRLASTHLIPRFFSHDLRWLQRTTVIASTAWRAAGPRARRTEPPSACRATTAFRYRWTTLASVSP